MNKTEMLKKNYEFRSILSKGKFFSGKQIEIIILKNNKNNNFLGIAVGTKNGKAFQRNRVKRIIRESYTRLEKQLIDGNSVVILMNKKIGIDEVNFSEVFKDMKNLFEKAKILKKEEKI